jgi:hypothetical protein
MYANRPDLCDQPMWESTKKEEDIQEGLG